MFDGYGFLDRGTLHVTTNPTPLQKLLQCFPLAFINKIGIPLQRNKPIHSQMKDEWDNEIICRWIIQIWYVWTDRDLMQF